MKLDHKVEVSEIARCLSEFAGAYGHLKENPTYFVVKVGEGPYSNAITVHKVRNKRASFFVISSELLERLKGTGLKFHQVASEKKKGPRDDDKIRIYDLTVDAIRKNEDILKDLVNSSIRIVEKRQSSQAKHQ